MKTFIHDDLDPQTTAMLQALYSRSPKSVTEHIGNIRTHGASSFMEQFYVGYGHKSIGDCGTTTLFIEDVSMLAAKAIQDSRLYNGQEASTRYMDMSTRPFLNPVGTMGGTELQKHWREIYSLALAALEEGIGLAFPLQEGENERVWKKTVKARAFDIARGLLPAGATTFVSWHTTLSHAHEHLSELDYHPLEEVSSLSTGARAALRTKYPASFGHVPDPEVAAFVKATYRAYQEEPETPLASGDFKVDTSLFRAAADNDRLWNNRPGRAFLSRAVEAWGRIAFRFPLDFGSFRDLQRHRSCLLEMPILTGRSFSPWYLEEIRKYIPATTAEGIEGIIQTFAKRAEALTDDILVRQYYLPMGFEVDTTIRCDLRSAVYIARLRASQAVHPTLRVVAQKMAKWLDSRFPGISQADFGPDEWSLKRGTHDIVKQEEEAVPA